jgi:transcriptional regulator with XRE-family HTH domain
MAKSGMDAAWSAFETLKKSQAVVDESKDTDKLNVIIQELAQIRENSGISQRKMRDLTGFGLNTINNFETFKGTTNNVNLIDKYMEVLCLKFNKEKGFIQTKTDEKRTSRKGQKQQ